MTKHDDAIAKALGASRVVELDHPASGGPLDLLALRREVGERIRSTGGRPTDPAWTLARQVPFKSESWIRLQDLAEEIGTSGRRVGPAQLAALLVESGLDEVEDAHWQEVLAASRGLPLFSAPDAAEKAQVTYNQFDEWVQKDWLRSAKRRGHNRWYGTDEVVRAHWLASLARSGGDVEELAPRLREVGLQGRYLVVTDLDQVSVADARAQLFRIIELPGSHLVIDQLPIRRGLLGLPPFPVRDHSEQDDAETRQAV